MVVLYISSNQYFKLNNNIIIKSFYIDIYLLLFNIYNNY